MSSQMWLPQPEYFMEVSLPGEIVMSLKASLVIAEWTANDPVLSKVKKSLRHGWTLIDEQFEEL